MIFFFCCLSDSFMKWVLRMCQKHFKGVVSKYLLAKPFSVWGFATYKSNVTCNGILELACLQILWLCKVCAIHQRKEIKMTFSYLQMHSSLEKCLDFSHETLFQMAQNMIWVLKHSCWKFYTLVLPSGLQKCHYSTQRNIVVWKPF